MAVPAAATRLIPVLALLLVAPWRATAGRPPPCPRPCSCPQPVELHCTFRSLVTFPPGISDQVERINLGFNSIHKMTDRSLSGLKKLELLMIHGNALHSLPDGVFRDLTSLQMLKMSYNKLSRISRRTLQGLWSLARLHLDHNRLEFIQPDAFQGLTSLRFLQLEGNRLRQLHPAALATFSLLGHFHVSTLRHLYLADNGLTSLHPRLLEAAPLLENLQLHGNPWSCDCHMSWLRDWDKRSPGVLKCKKDKDYPGGELCPVCSFPRHLQGKEVQALDDMVCSGPVITSPLRAAKPEDAESEVMTPEFSEPLGNITLGLSDEHGNKVDLECGVGKPRELRRVNWEQVSPQRLAANITWSVDLDCPIDRENYERLWRLIAYYSDVPAHLRREMMLSKEPQRSYRYRQDMERDAQYYTGVKVIVTAQPRWLMQASLGLRLNRPQSTGKRVKLVLSSRLSQSVEAELERRRGRTWVMIESTNTTQVVMAAVVGGTGRMQCSVRSSGEIVLRWVMPDGSRLEVPHNDPNGRVSASRDGQLVIKSIDHSDMGIYYCVAKVHGDLDILPFRLVVEESSSPRPGDDRPQPLPVHYYTGESIALPCEASGSPNAEINWILPQRNIVSTKANTSRALVYSNGTLRVLQGQLSDSGYYKCIAINQHGVDTYATKVNVTKRATQTMMRTQRKFPKTPQSASGVRTKITVPTEESVDGSGDEQVMKDVNTKTKLDAVRRRGPMSGRRVISHPSRNMWRRPPVPRNPAQPRVVARKPLVDARRRVNVASNKIDPRKWADILAKVRDRKVQKSVTPNTVQQTPERKRTDATTDPTIRRQNNMEGSGEGGAMQEEEAIHTTTPTPMRILSTMNYVSSVRSTSASKPTTRVTSNMRANTIINVTPNPRKMQHDTQAATHDTRLVQSTRVSSNKPVTHKSRATADARHGTQSTQGMRLPQITQGIKHTTPTTPLTNSGRRVASTNIPPLQQQQPTSAPQSSLTRWQTSTNRAGSRGSVSHDESSQGSQDTATDVPVVTTHNASHSQSEGKRKVVTHSGDFSAGKDRQVSVDVSRLSGRVAPTAPLSVKYLSQASTAWPPEESATVDIFPAQTQLSTASPTNRPQSSPLTAVNEESRREGPPRHRRPNSKRKNGGRRKSKENRRRQRLNGAPRLISSTLIPGVDALLAGAGTTASIPLKIEKAAFTTLSFPAAVPFTGSQVTSSGTPSHKESTVSRLDDNRPDLKSTSSPATKDDRLSRAKPPAKATTVFPTPPLSTTPFSTTPFSTTPISTTLRSTVRLPTTAPRALLSAISLSEAQNDGTVSRESVPEVSEGESAFPPDRSDSDHPPSPAAALHTFPSSTLPPVKPSVETQGGSVPGDRQPALHFDKSPGSAHTLPQVEPDVPQQNQSGHRHGHSQVAENELFIKIHRPVPLLPPPSAHAPTVQHEAATSSGEHEPSGTEGLPEDKLEDNVWEKWLTTTQGPFATGLSSDPTKTDAVDEHPKLSTYAGAKVVGSTLSAAATTPSPPATTPSPPATTPSPPATTPSPPTSTPSPPATTPSPPATTPSPPATTPSRPASTPSPPATSSNPPISHTVLLGVMLPTVASSTASPRAGAKTGPVGNTLHQQGPGFNHIPEGQATRDKARGQGRELPPLTPHGQSRNFSRPSANKMLLAPRLETHPQNRNVVDFHPGPNPVSPAPKLSDSGHPVKRTTTTQTPRVVPSTAAATPAVAVQTSGASSASREGRPVRPLPPLTRDASGVRPRPAPLSPPRGNPWIMRTYTQTVTVNTETDAHLPCEAVGQPHPFLSWTKVSTGASIAQNMKVNRFEVHSNGTLVIRSAQPTDRGQYRCRVQSQHGEDQVTLTLAVLLQHPRVLQPRHRDVTVHQGAGVHLDCTVRGHPPPRITWVLPDQVRVVTASLPAVSSDRRLALLGNGTLRISRVGPGDRGVYRCLGSSVAGTDAVTVRLHVSAAAPPAIVQAARDNASLAEGASAFLHCTATGSPPPTVHWTTPDGTRLAAAATQLGVGRNLLVFPNGTLRVHGATAGDAGRYECTAGNAMAASRRTVFLSVRRAEPSPAKARISVSSPPTTDVVYGGALRLDCRATGDPAPRVIWRTPTKKLVDSQYSYDPRIKVLANGSLIIQPVTEEDAGDFLCLARNRAGEDFARLRVDVLTRSPARIQRKRLRSGHQEDEEEDEEEEEEVAVVYGGHLRMDCVASGLPDPDITWALPDGTMLNADPKLRPGRNRRYVVLGNGTLLFNAVGMPEEGDYTCYAENQLGKDQMKVRVKVKVAARPPRFRDGGRRRVVGVPYGETASLPCSADGEPAPVLSWISPAHRVIAPVPGKYGLLDDGTLLVHGARRSDGGNYTCVARNAAGQSREATALEVLLTPPSINGLRGVSAVSAAAVRGQTALVDCVAVGTPPPRVMWVLPGKAVVPVPYHAGRTTVHPNGTLELRAARPGDAGRLTCVARNEAGEARLAVDLAVGEAPQVDSARTESWRLTGGGTVVLNCSLPGVSAAHLTWVLPGGVPLPSGARLPPKFSHRPDGSLVISDASAADAGAYRCLGRHAGGLVELTVTVSPPAGGGPEIAHRYAPSVRVQTGGSLWLHCPPGGVEPIRLTWTLPSGVALSRPQRVGRYAVLPNGTLAIRQASVYDRGSYVCRVADAYGEAPPSAVRVEVSPPPPPSAPRITGGPPSVTYARRGVALQLDCVVAVGSDGGGARAEVAWETPDRVRLAVGTHPRLYGNKYVHPQGALVIQNPTARDAGLYRCTARNAVGSDSKATYLNVF